MSSIINAPMLSHVVAQWCNLWFQCFSLVSVSWPFEFISPPCGKGIGTWRSLYTLSCHVADRALTHWAHRRVLTCRGLQGGEPEPCVSAAWQKPRWKVTSLRSVWQVGGRLRRRRQRLTHCVEAAETKEKSSSCTEDWFCLFVGTPIKHTRKHRP